MQRAKYQTSADRAEVNMTASVDQQGGLYKLTNPEKQNLVLTHSLLAVNVARN